MAEKPLRVRLDLTEINLLPYKYVWVPLPSRDLKTIEDFKSTLYQKFNFDRNKKIKLFVQDSLLLDEETVLLLREDDIVKVVYDSQIFPVDCNESQSLIYENAKTKKRKNRCQEESGSISHTSQKDSKYLKLSQPEEIYEYDVPTTSSMVLENCLLPTVSEITPKKASKKKKKKHYHSEKNINSPESVMATAEDLEENSNSKHTNFVTVTKETRPESALNYNPMKIMTDSDSNKMSRKKCKDSSTIVTDSISSLTDETSYPSLQATEILNSPKQLNVKFNTDWIPFAENVCTPLNDDASDMKLQISSDTPETKDKTKVLRGNNCRKKKRKRKRKKTTIETPDPEDISVNKPSESNSFQSETMPNDSYSTRKHIIFAEQTNDCTIDLKRSNSKAQVVDINLYLEQFKSDGVSSRQNQSQSTYNTGDYVTLTMSTPRSPMEDHSETWGMTPVMKTSGHEDNWIESKNDSIDTSACKKKFSYSSLPPLNSIPEIGTIIAYKTLELSALYCPEVTPYKEGIVKDIDRQTDEMEIELVNEEIKWGRTGKFENIYPDDEPDDAVVIKTVKLNWASLIEPKLIHKT